MSSQKLHLDNKIVSKTAQLDGGANKAISSVSDYCIPTAGSPSGQYIKNVTIGSINNDSGASANGYSDFTSQSISINDITTISVTPQITWSATRIKAWVDWNQDGNFDNSSETVLNSSGNLTTYSTSFTVPSGVSGEIILRVRVAYANDPAPCGVIYFIEKEDYTLRFDDVTSPAVPANLSAHLVGDDPNAL
ncbi:GEVED domain-containing protein [Aquimarina sp. 2201CG1-2-11]|uniref:GEVED domain-containing protein n=1 Tax=Aquimarina discodermiae TaxID=3231043 RepID=UPI003461EE74